MSNPRNLREPSPKAGGMLNKWLVGTILGGGVVFAAWQLTTGSPPPMLPEEKQSEAPVATSGQSMLASLPTDYSHMFKPEPAVEVVEEPAREEAVMVTEPIRPPLPPMAPVARCQRPPTTYAPGNLHRASADATAYRDCLANRNYAIAMANYQREQAQGASGGAMAGFPGGSSGSSPAMAPASSSGSAGSTTSGSVQNASFAPRDRHEDFQARSAENTAIFYAQEPEELPIDECVIQAGSKIPAVLLSGIDTNAAGSVAAQTTRDVYDVTGTCLAIPAGSRLVGRYDHITGHGQKRVALAWEAITLPDYTTVSLAGMNGTDVSGTAGVKGNVNNHNAAFLGAVILGSLVEAAPSLAGLKADVTFGSVAGDASSAGQKIIERELNRQPTITVPAGTEVAVDVLRHLVMGAR